MLYKILGHIVECTNRSKCQSPQKFVEILDNKEDILKTKREMCNCDEEFKVITKHQTTNDNGNNKRTFTSAKYFRYQISYTYAVFCSTCKNRSDYCYTEEKAYADLIEKECNCNSLMEPTKTIRHEMTIYEETYNTEIPIGEKYLESKEEEIRNNKFLRTHSK